MAGPSLYTSKLEPADLECLELPVRLAISELRNAFPDQAIEPKAGGDGLLILQLWVGVDLPSRGPVDDVNIRETEPIFLLFSCRDYPHVAPAVFSDRQDFPGARLPHLNPVPPGHPASFCLHRGNINDWFAEHTVVDLVERVRDWLRDAAADRLVREGDGFEPTRPGQEVGYVVYDPAVVTGFVQERWRQSNGAGGFAFLWHEWLQDPEDPRVAVDLGAVRLVHVLPAEALLRSQEELTQLVNQALRSRRGTKLEDRLMGILAWPAEGRVCREYFAELPDELSGFRKWTKNLSIPVGDGIDAYLSESLQLTGGREGVTQQALWTPVTLVIPRPQKLIGADTTLELLDFVIEAGDKIRLDSKSWGHRARVARLGHRAPLTLRTAKDISSQPPDVDLGKLLFLGCGAVGSKLILHLARSGQGRMTLVDNDVVSPHNLVRYGLTNEALGVPKAEAMKKSVEGIFYADDTTEVEVVLSSALDVLHGDRRITLRSHSWLIDATASSMVLNALAQANLPEGLTCCRCEIADEGRLGFLSVEGAERNPRVDDLWALIFDRAVEDDGLSRWLHSNRERRERTLGPVLEEIDVGISCSSETMRLADEDVSLHAAAFSRGFRKSAMEGKSEVGSVQIGRLDAGEGFTTTIERFPVLPMTVLEARGDPAWQVRLKAGLEREINNLLRTAGPDETGGFLIGMADFKAKVVHVTRILPAPPDSAGGPNKFVRGVEHAPDELTEIRERTGGILGYVGEWHSHPRGGSRLSPQDEKTVDDLRSDLGHVPLPAVVVIATGTELAAYVFAPE